MWLCRISLSAVRFPPTGEGSGTKSPGRRPKNRASFQVIPSVRTQLVRFWPYLFTCEMFWFLGSLHLPAVTSVIPGLNSDLRGNFATEIAVRSYMTVCRIVPQCRTLTKRAIPKVEVLYVVMGCSETSILSTRSASRR